MAAFDLTRNAFALLDVTPRANRAQLEDAYQDALLEADNHKAEAVLNRAQQSLISPRDRLESELGYFIDTKPSTAKTILSSLRNGASGLPFGEVAGRVRQGGVISAVAVGHRQAALAVMCRG